MELDYDSLADQALKATPLQAPPTTDYDSLAGTVIDMQAARDKAMATKNTIAASGANPDQEAKALAASKTLGMPQPAAMANPEQASQAALLQKNVATLNGAPELSSFIAGNPLAARLAQDDFDKLGIVERLTTALKSGVSEALASNALGRAGNVKQLADLAGATSPNTDQQIEGLEGRVTATPKLSGVLGTVQNFAGFITGLIDNAAQGGSAGAVAGAGAGALVGGLPGAAAGFGIGGVFGFNADMARVAAGNSYLRLGNLRGSDGQPISEAGRQFGAVFTGAATYALGRYGAAIESKFLGQSADKIAQDAIAQAVQTPTFTRAVTQFAGGTAKGGVQGAGFMTAMEAANVVGDEIAKTMSAGHFDSDPQEIVQRLAGAAINGALTLGVLHGSIAGLGLYGDFRAAQRAQGQIDVFKSLLEGADGSKLRERDLEGFQQFLKGQTDGSPVENLYIPASVVRELYQGAKLDPSRLTPEADPIFGFVPDMAKQLAEGAESGGDVVIPTADFVSHLAGSDIATKLMPDIRVGADAMSLNEAKTFQEEYQARVKEAVDEASKSTAEPDAGQQIAQTVREQAVSVGRPDAEASRLGAIYSARYIARAERRGLGEDPLALYQAEGAQIGGGALGRELNQPAYHGSPHNFDKFDISKLGTGEGAQVYGHGLYFAENKGVAEGYQKTLSGRLPSGWDSVYPASARAYIRGMVGDVAEGRVTAERAAKHIQNANANMREYPVDQLAAKLSAGAKLTKGSLYTVDIPDEHVANFLHWDKTLSEQTEVVRGAINRGEDIKNLSGQVIAGPSAEGSADPTGQDLYGMLQARKGPEAASTYLDSLGIKGIKYLDQGSRGAGEGTHNLVVFDDKIVKLTHKDGTPVTAAERKEFLQSSQGTNEPPRGKIVFGQDGAKTIQTFEKADSSTLIHESGHAWLEELLADGNRPDAPGQIREDLNTVTKWLGSDDGKITDAQHEQFARAAEAYFMEGKAPSAGLARVFSRFKQWLTKIYRTVASLDTPINDDIRQVFDRLLATDSEIEEAKKTTGLEPGFKDRKQAGMTAAEWGAYTRAIDKANQQAESTMLDKMMAKVRRQRSVEYREERRGVAEDVAKEVDARPDMQALNLLRSGKMPDGTDVGERMRLSTEAIRKVYGKDGLEALPKGITSKDGFEPDYVSEMLGFDSPDSMIRALQSLEGQQRELKAAGGKGSIRQHLIDSEADRRMADRKGELEDENAVKDEAIAALHSEGRAEQLAVELRYLRRQGAQALVSQGKKRAGTEEPPTGGGVLKAAQWNEQADKDLSSAMRGSVEVTKPMLEAIRARVDQILAQKTTAEVGRFAQFLRDERKAAREVQQAILAKDWGEAAAAKQRQILAHILYTKARQASEEIEQGTALFKRLAGKKFFKAIDQAYTDQIHDLLGRFGFDSGRGEELQRGKTQTLEDFVRSKSEDSGIELQVDPVLFDMGGKPKDDLTLSEFRALHEAVDSMQELGRGEKLISVDGVKRDLAEVVDEIVTQIRSLGERPKSDYYDPRDEGLTQAAKDKLFGVSRAIDASLTKPEAFFDQIDRGDPFGIMNRAVFRRLKDAQHNEDLWQKAAAGKLEDAVKAAGKGWRKALRQLVPDDPNLLNPETGRPMKLSRERMITLALNWGNEGQRQKLADGYKWDPRAVKLFLDRNMTKADWDFVQNVWGIFESNRPELDALQRRVTGVGLDLVKADRFSTPHGEYEGGYYPIVYDASRDYKSEAHAEKASVDTLFPTNYTRATTPKGSTISRVEGVKRPIELSLDIAPWKIGQVLHDIAFREAIMDADRLLSDGRVKKALDDVFGSEYRKTLPKWLKHVANSRNIDDRAIGWVDKMISSARTSVVMVGIGFRAGTLAKHTMSALSNSIKELGPQWMLSGTREFYTPGKMKENWAFVQAKSPEMAFRLNAYDKDVRSNYEHLVSDNRYTAFQKAAQHYGHIAISYFDLGSAAPTWLGAYRKALSEGMEDKDAVYVADKTVRNAHGAQGITDTAAFQRAGGTANLFNMFYGFFNHIYNRQRTMFMQGAEGARNVKAGEFKAATKNFADVLATSFYYVAVPALIEAIVSSGGPNEDKDEGWGAWAGKAILAEIPAGVPIMRDIAKAAIEGRDYEMSPLAHAMNTIIQGGRDIAKVASGEDQPPSLGKHVVEAAGYLAGLPTAAPFTAGKFLWDYGTGEADPQDIAEWYRGLTTGKVVHK